MDNNKVLRDDNLETLDLIKDIDIYSLVDREINKKREKFKVCSIIIATLLVLSLGFMLGLAVTFFKQKTILVAMGIYYILSTWVMMLLMIPFIKRKRSY